MRRLIGVMLIGCVGAVLGLPMPAVATHLHSHSCPSDSVRVGTTCLDTYEASVWKIVPVPPATALSAAQKEVIKKIRAGTVTLANLTAIGATQLGVSSDDYGTDCADDGTGCVNVYALSIPGVTPSRFINWFQASAVVRNSFKRLPTNAEWTPGALGTPDPGTDDDTTDCNLGLVAVVNTGSRSNCVSDAGAMDMVGNLWEWVADWVPLSTFCVTSLFASDNNCLAGASTTAGPGALIRGGGFGFGTGETAGVFAVRGDFGLSTADISIGFRGAR